MYHKTDIRVEMIDLATNENVTRTIDISNFHVIDYDAPAGMEGDKIERDSEKQKELLERWINERANEQHETFLQLKSWTILEKHYVNQHTQPTHRRYKMLSKKVDIIQDELRKSGFATMRYYDGCAAYLKKRHIEKNDILNIDFPFEIKLNRLAVNKKWGVLVTA